MSTTLGSQAFHVYYEHWGKDEIRQRRRHHSAQALLQIMCQEDEGEPILRDIMSQMETLDYYHEILFYGAWRSIPSLFTRNGLLDIDDYEMFDEVDWGYEIDAFRNVQAIVGLL